MILGLLGPVGYGTTSTKDHLLTRCDETHSISSGQAQLAAQRKRDSTSTVDDAGIRRSHVAIGTQRLRL